MICPHCNRETPDGSKFCRRCGAAMPKHKENKPETPVEENPKQPEDDVTTPTAEVHVKTADPPVYTSETHVHTSETVTPPPVIPPVPPVPPIPTTVVPPTVVYPTDNHHIPSEIQDEESSGMIYKEKRRIHPMVWVGVGAGIVILIALGYLLLTGRIFEKGSSRSRLSVSDRDTEMNLSQSNDYAYADTVAVEEVAEVVEEVPVEDTVAVYTSTPVSKVYVPDASYTSSSEAYDSHASYLTDKTIGQDWGESDAVRSVINGGNYYYMSGSGYISQSDIEFSAVKGPDNRIYGRYHNENGTNLDMNGVQDASGNLIIKLGHGAATSYWVLRPTGSSHNSGSGTYSYRGSWGKSDKDSGVDIYFYN